MKNVWICFLFFALLCACNGPDSETGSSSPSAAKPAQVKDSHTAVNALDYYGIYTPDAEDVHLTEVELAPENRYRLRTDAGEEKTGEYRWDVTGRVVILMNSGTPDLQFFVGENFLRLDSTTPTVGERFTKQ